MNVRRKIAALAAGVALSGAALTATAAPANAEVDGNERCWSTSWVYGMWYGIAGHCVYDGVVYWYDFDGNYGVGSGY